MDKKTIILDGIEYPQVDPAEETIKDANGNQHCHNSIHCNDCRACNCSTSCDGSVFCDSSADCDDSTHCTGCVGCIGSTLCDGCIACNSSIFCDNSAYCDNCTGCIGSTLCDSSTYCHNSVNCIYCNELTLEKYMIFNKQVTKTEFDELNKRIEDNIHFIVHPKNLSEDDITWLKDNIRQFDQSILDKIISDSILPDKPKK